MISVDRVVRILLGDVADVGHQLIDHPRVGGDAVGDDLGRGRPVLKGAGEESPDGRQVSLLGDQHVDHLPELVDRPVQINPPPGNLDVGLIYKPAITWRMSARSCRLDQQRCEALHPPEDRDVINSDGPTVPRLRQRGAAADPRRAVAAVRVSSVISQ